MLLTIDECIVLFTDINECTMNIHNCTEICENTNGSYVCDCYVGYILETDGRNCNGMWF